MEPHVQFTLHFCHPLFLYLPPVNHHPYPLFLQVNTDGMIIKTITGSLVAPQGLCIHDNRLYVCDTTTHRVLSYNLEEEDGEVVVCGTGQQGKELEGGKRGN